MTDLDKDLTEEQKAKYMKIAKKRFDRDGQPRLFWNSEVLGTYIKPKKES